jgi:excisionase family DNA binding protein
MLNGVGGASVDRLAYRPKELPAITGLSRSFVYKLISEGTLPAVRCGRAIVVSAEALRQYLAGKPSEGAGR